MDIHFKENFLKCPIFIKYEKLLECTDRKFEDIDYLYAKRKEPKNQKK